MQNLLQIPLNHHSIEGHSDINAPNAINVAVWTMCGVIYSKQTKKAEYENCWRYYWAISKSVLFLQTAVVQQYQLVVDGADDGADDDVPPPSLHENATACPRSCSVD